MSTLRHELNCKGTIVMAPHSPAVQYSITCPNIEDLCSARDYEKIFPEGLNIIDSSLACPKIINNPGLSTRSVFSKIYSQSTYNKTGCASAKKLVNYVENYHAHIKIISEKYAVGTVKVLENERKGLAETYDHLHEFYNSELVLQEICQLNGKRKKIAKLYTLLVPRAKELLSSTAEIQENNTITHLGLEGMNASAFRDWLDDKNSQIEEMPLYRKIHDCCKKVSEGLNNQRQERENMESDVSIITSTAYLSAAHGLPVNILTGDSGMFSLLERLYKMLYDQRDPLLKSLDVVINWEHQSVGNEGINHKMLRCFPLHGTARKRI